MGAFIGTCDVSAAELKFRLPKTSQRARLQASTAFITKSSTQNSEDPHFFTKARLAIMASSIRL